MAAADPVRLSPLAVPSLPQVTAVFAKSYRQEWWGSGLGSGPGSTVEATADYRCFLAAQIEAAKPRTIVDIGCGDWQFSRLVDWRGADYLGIDVVPEIIENNRRRYESGNIRFEVRDIFQNPPVADMMIAKDVLQHWPTAMIAAFLSMLPNFRLGLITNCIEAEGRQANSSIELGGYRPLDILAPPFSAPVCKVFEYRTPAPHREHKAVMLWRRDGASAFGSPGDL